MLFLWLSTRRTDPSSPISFHMCDMTRSYVCDMTRVWHDSCVTWLICDMTHVWHDSCVTCLMMSWMWSSTRKTGVDMNVDPSSPISGLMICLSLSLSLSLSLCSSLYLPLSLSLSLSFSFFLVISPSLSISVSVHLSLSHTHKCWHTTWSSIRNKNHISSIWMSHVPLINESCPTYKWVTSLSLSLSRPLSVSLAHSIFLSPSHSHVGWLRLVGSLKL